MKGILTLIIVLCSLFSIAQQDYSAVWIDYSHKNKLNDKWTVVSDYGYRVRFGYKNSYHRLHARTGFGYRVSENVSAWAGVGVFMVSSPSFLSGEELRPWQGVKINGPDFGNFKIKHFVRLEERFQFYTMNDVVYYSGFTLKFRYMIQLDYQFNQPENDKGKWVVFASFEPFISLYSSSGLIEVTTSRSELGVSYSFSKKTKINALYCYQTGNIPFLEDHPVYENIVRLSVIQSF